MVLTYFLCLQCAPMSCVCLDFPFAQISVNIVCIDEVSPRYVWEYVQPSLNGLKMLYYTGCICQVSLQCVLMLCGCSEYLYVQISVHTECIYDFFFRYVLMFCVSPVSFCANHSSFSQTIQKCQILAFLCREEHVGLIIRGCLGSIPAGGNILSLDFFIFMQ